MNPQETKSATISSDDDKELKQTKKFVQEYSAACEQSKRVISKIVLDIKKLQQSGLDRKIAEALSRQKVNATTTTTTTERSNQRLSETMNDEPIISNVISSSTNTITTTTTTTTTAITTPSVETIATTTSAAAAAATTTTTSSSSSNNASSQEKVYFNASKNLRNIIPPTITITKAMDSPPERMSDAPSCSTPMASKVNETRLDLMSSKDRLEHAKKLIKRNILIKRAANFNPESSASASTNQLSVPKAVIVRSIMNSRDITNTKPAPKILNFTNQMKTTNNMTSSSSPTVDQNRDKECQSQLRNPLEWSTSEAYCDFKRPFPKKTPPTGQQIRQPVTTTTTTTSSTSSFSPIDTQKHNTNVNNDDQSTVSSGSNLIVLENKILTPDEKIDLLQDLRLNTHIKGKEENSLSKIQMKLPSLIKVVEQPKKIILSADKLKRTPAELAALAKQIQSSISTNKGSSGGGIQKSLLKLKALKNVDKSTVIKIIDVKSLSQTSLKDNATATTSKVTSNQVIKSYDSPDHHHHHNTIVGAPVTIDNPSHDKQNSSQVSSNKYKSHTESHFQSFPIHDNVNDVNDVNVQSQIFETFTEENQTIETLNPNFENENNNRNTKQLSDKLHIPESINQEEHITESNQIVVTDTDSTTTTTTTATTKTSTNDNAKYSSSSGDIERNLNVDKNKTDEIETTIAETVSKPILSAVDFIAALTASNPINETMAMELSPEELDLNATFSLNLSTNHLTDSLTEEERQLMQATSSSLNDVNDISIGQILPLNNINILDATVDKTADSNILHIVSAQETEDQKANVNTELVTATTTTTTTNDNLLDDSSSINPKSHLPIATEICISNSNKQVETSKVDVTEKIPENVAPQRKVGRFKKGKINLVQRIKPNAKKSDSIEKVQSTDMGDLPQESTDQIEILEPLPASNKEGELIVQEEAEETLNIEKVTEQNTGSNQIEKISSYDHIDSLDSSDLNVVLSPRTKVTENDATSKEEQGEQQIVEESLEPNLHKDPEEVIIDTPNTLLFAALNYVEPDPDHGPPQVPFKANTSLELVNEKVERPVGINNLIKIIEEKTIQQGNSSAVLEGSKSDETEVQSVSSKDGTRSQPRKKLIKAKPVLKTKRQTKNKDDTQNSNSKLSNKEDMEKADKDQEPLKDFTTIDEDNENVSITENRVDDAQKELNKLDALNPLEGKLHHLTPKRKKSNGEKKDDELSTQSIEFIASNALGKLSSSINQSNQLDPVQEERVESSLLIEAAEENCATTGLEYNMPTVQFKRRRLETEQESELEIENTITQFTKYSCDDETAKDESSQDDHCILADRKRLRKTYHNKIPKTVEPLSDSDDERFFGFDEPEIPWNPRRPSAKDKRDPTSLQVIDIPSSSNSSVMPLKKRWELVKNSHNETEITDDTSPIEDENIEEIQPKDNRDNEHIDESQVKETIPSNNVEVDPTFVEPIEASKTTKDFDKSKEESTNKNKALKLKFKLQSNISSKVFEHSEENEIVVEINKNIPSAVPQKKSLRLKIRKDLGQCNKFLISEPQPAKRRRRGKSSETSMIMEHEAITLEKGYIENDKSDDKNKVNIQTTKEVTLLESLMTPQPKKRGRKPKQAKTQSSAMEINDITIVDNMSPLAKDSQRSPSPMSETTESDYKLKKAKTKSSATEFNNKSIKDNMSPLAEKSQRAASSTPEPKKRGRKPKQAKTQSSAMEINEDSIVDNMSTLAKETPLAEESQRRASPMSVPKKRGRKSKQAKTQQSSVKEINEDSIVDNMAMLAKDSHRAASPMSETTESDYKPKQTKTQSSTTENNDDSIKDNMPLTEELQRAESPMPIPKKRGRKPKHLKPETESTASEVCVEVNRENISSIEISPTEENVTTPQPKKSGRKSILENLKNSKTGVNDGGAAITFNPRLLLIRKRDQLKSNEELTEPDNGNGPLQCGLCLGRTNKNGWIGHLSKHYGIGWLVGETPLNLSSRSLILSTLTNFFRKTGIKGLTCRMCQRLYRSALGLLLHIEMCGEEQQKFECFYCQKSYTKLSLPVHERQCGQRMALATKGNQETEIVSNAEECNESSSNQATHLFHNSGRAKRVATIKAESKLKVIGKALMESEDMPDFDPKEFVKYESGYNLNKLQKKWEGELKNFGSTFCHQKICTFSTSDLSLMLKHLDNCKHIQKPGYYCTACKKGTTTKFESAAEATKHVMEKHQPVADFDTEDGSDYDNSNNNHDQDDDDDDDLSSGVDSNEDEPLTESSGNDDDDAGSESGKLQINRSKTKVPINSSQKHLFPGRQMHLHKIMSHKWHKFVKDNHSTDLLFDFALPMYKKLDEIEALKYLPAQKTSIKVDYESTRHIEKNFGTKTAEQREWTQLERFESMQQKNEHFTFIGGAIRHLAWIPLPGNANEQYLAISYYKSLQYTRHCNPKLSPSIILILKFIESRNSDSDAWQLNSSVHYGIRISEGPVHSFAFLPSGGYNEEINRLGLIAVACAAQNIKIYALPLKLSEDHHIETDSSFIVLDLTAALVLTLELQPENIENKLCHDLQCMQICWSESKGHNLLFGGFSNGCIGFWDIEENEAENLNRFIIEGMRYFVPLNCIYFGEKNVRYLALHYGEDGPHWLAVSGATRRYGIINIRNLSAPQKFAADINTQITSCVDWPPMWESATFGWCNVLSKIGGRAICLNPIGVAYYHSTIDLMLSTPRSVHYSCELLVQAFGNDNGDLIVLNPRELHLESTILKSQNNQRAISTLDVQCLSGDETTSVKQKELDKPTMHNEDFKQRYGIIYKSLIKVPCSKKSIYLDDKRRPPHNLLNYLRVNCVRFNGNASAHNWLAAGCENGFLRILNFKRNSYFDMR